MDPEVAKYLAESNRCKICDADWNCRDQKRKPDFFKKLYYVTIKKNEHTVWSHYLKFVCEYCYNDRCNIKNIKIEEEGEQGVIKFATFYLSPGNSIKYFKRDVYETKYREYNIKEENEILL